MIATGETITENEGAISPYAKAAISAGLITFGTIGYLAMKWANNVVKPKSSKEQDNNNDTIIEMTNANTMRF